MHLTDYMKWTDTSLSPELERGSPKWRTYVALKLIGEAGEVCDKLGKLVRDENADLSGADLEALTAKQTVALAHELGDVLWYLGQIGLEYGWDPGVSGYRPKLPTVRAASFLAHRSLAVADYLAFSALPAHVAEFRWTGALMTLALLAYKLGLTLEQIADLNVTKLEDRKARGVLGGSGDQR